jgi:hypothetical protein
MARPDSDTDRLGVYAAPTEAFHGLTPPTDKTATIARTDPDVTLHEVGKFCRLALACNPTVMELLWLPEHTHTTTLGTALVGLRRRFLSAQRVRDAYLGYAAQQFYRLEQKGKFPKIPAASVAKHARHLLRLVDTGTRLWVSGELVVAVPDPARVFMFGERVVAEGAEVAKPVLERARLTFDRCDPALPEKPDRDAVEKWLSSVRALHYSHGGA